MHRVGFEPTKLYASDLKSDPFDHSGIDAKVLISVSWGFYGALPLS